MGQPKMVITVPDKGRQTYLITRLPLIIGSGERCHVQITASDAVGDQHLRISRNDESGFLIATDLNSGSPTMLNGQPITECEVDDADRLVVGDTWLEFFYPPEIEPGAPLELNIFAGPLAGKRIPLTQAVTVGRQSTNTISVQQANISGKHAVIELARGQIAVTDLESRNGTRVNGHQIPPKKAVPLAGGDIIDIGSISMMLVPKGGGPRVKRSRQTSQPNITAGPAGPGGPAGPPRMPGDAATKARTRVDHDRKQIMAELGTGHDAPLAPPPPRIKTPAPPTRNPAPEGPTRRKERVGGLPPGGPGAVGRPGSAPAQKRVSSQDAMKAVRAAQDQADAPQPMFEKTLDLDADDVPEMTERYRKPPSTPSAPPPAPGRPAGGTSRRARPDDNDGDSDGDGSEFEDSLIDLADLERAMGDDPPSTAPPPMRPPPPPPPPPVASAFDEEAPEVDWDAIDSGAPPPPGVNAHSAQTLVDNNYYDDGGPPPPPPPPFGAHSAQTLVDNNVYDDSPVPPPNPFGDSPHSAATLVDNNVYDEAPPPQFGADGYRPPAGDDVEFDLNDLAAGIEMADRGAPGAGSAGRPAPPPPPPLPAGGTSRRPPMAQHGGGGQAGPGGGGGGGARPPLQPHAAGPVTGWRPTNGPLPPELEHYRGQIPVVDPLVGPAMITLPAIPDEAGEGADAHLTVQPATPVRPKVGLGRRRTNELRLPHGECSGEHSVIEANGNRVTVRDLGSLNGTFVNGTRIDGPRALNRYDEVVVGPYRFLFIPPGEHFPPG